MAKLTAAQKERLAYMAKQPDGSCMAANTYKPTQRLVYLGFATRRSLRGYLYSSKFTITDAGRAALAEAEKGA